MKLRSTLLIAAAVLLTGVLAAQPQGVNSNLNTVFNIVYDASTSKPTYSATKSGITLASAATDVCLLTGSASRTIKVRRVLVSGNATAVVTDPIMLIKRSTVPTDGTGTLPTVGPYDSNSQAGTAVAEVFTGNPTSGTLVAELMTRALQFANLSTGQGSVVEFVFGQLGSAVVLRGIAESVTVNLLAQTFSGGSISCTFEWTEG